MLEQRAAPSRIGNLLSIAHGLKTIRDSKAEFVILYLLNNGGFGETKLSKDSFEKLILDLKWLYPFARALFYKGPRSIIPKPPSKKRL